jgi:hypothetical protein
MASLIIGINTRFDTNPGASFTSTGVFPIATANARVRSYVSCDVAIPRMTSTSFITGTGFMKCIPMNRSGLRVAPASLVIDIELVLLARIAFESSN